MCGESWKKKKQYIKVSPSSSFPHEICGRMAGRYRSHYELKYEKTKKGLCTMWRRLVRKVGALEGLKAKHLSWRICSACMCSRGTDAAMKATPKRVTHAHVMVKSTLFRHPRTSISQPAPTVQYVSLKMPTWKGELGRNITLGTLWLPALR